MLRRALRQLALLGLIRLRAEVLMLQPDVLALQECASSSALRCLASLYKLVGCVAAHAGLVHLYVMVDQVVEALPRIGRDTPAVAVKLSLGTEKLVVAAAHLAANQKGYLSEQPKGLTGRRVALRAIVMFVDAERGAVVLLGDLNVREEEVWEVLEMGRWRDPPHHGRSFGPRVNDFDGPVKRCSYGFGSGHRFDRIWFRGAV